MFQRRGVVDAGRGSGARAIPALAVLLMMLVVGCSDSDSGPTSPMGPTGPTTLFGVWQGSMTAIRADTGAQMTCNLTMELVDSEDPQIEIGVGNWEVSCPDGSMGGEFVVATRILFEFVALVAFSGEPFSGCGWGSSALLEPGRLSGDWTADQSCPVAWSGRFDLSL